VFTREIKRIVFETSFKNDGSKFTRVPIAQVKQIAGRAGRYRTAVQDIRDTQMKSSTAGPTASSPSSENVGLVTTLHAIDLPYIQDAMSAEAPPLTAAGIQPPAEVVKRFASYFPPSTPFRFILKRLFDSSSIHNRNFISNNQEQLVTADAIEDIKELSITDRYTISLCPVNLRDESMRPILRAFARCVAGRSGGGFLDIPELNLEILDLPVSGNRDYLHQLEVLHKAIGLYCWLSFRFRGVFTNQAMAMYTKELVERQIERGLSEFSANKKLRSKLLFQRRKLKEEWMETMKREQSEEKQQLAEVDVETGMALERDEGGLSGQEKVREKASLQEPRMGEEEVMVPDEGERVGGMIPGRITKDENTAASVHG
jgi:ATP-dependent RNA helicase SUPV3L1/SUV3